MSTTNTIQIAIGEESPLGTPATEMELLRITGESVTLRNTFQASNEIRADRQPRGDTLVDAEVSGSIDFLLAYGTQDERIAGAFMSAWASQPTKYNAGTADSNVTAVTNSSDTFTVDAGGAAFLAGMLVKTSGFADEANNGIFVVASSTATTIVVAGAPTLVDDAAPAATARIKVVGFHGDSGDITATATGLASTTLDFAALGLAKGQWIKIGGAGGDYRFGTAADNDWCRIAAIAQHALTLDNRPAGWATDNGAGNTIRVWTSDRLRNGATKRAWTLEKGFTAHSPINYLVFNGLLMSSLQLNIRPGTQVTGQLGVAGTTANSPTTTPIDASPSEPADTGAMNGVTDVGRLAEGGVTVAGPNYIQSMTFNLQNNLLQGKAVGYLGSAVVQPGQLSISGELATYFGDAAIWNKIVNNTRTSLSLRLVKDSQAYVLGMPAVRLRGDAPAATRSNEWATINSSYVAEYDAAMGFTVSLDRFEYFE